MYRPINEPIDVLAVFRESGGHPLVKAFRWRDRRYDVELIERVRRCSQTPPAGEGGPPTLGHFSSRWTGGAAGSGPAAVEEEALCYCVLTRTDRFELRLDPLRSLWWLEGIHADDDAAGR